MLVDPLAEHRVVDLLHRRKSKLRNGIHVSKCRVTLKDGREGGNISIRVHASLAFSLRLMHEVEPVRFAVGSGLNANVPPDDKGAMTLDRSVRFGPN